MSVERGCRQGGVGGESGRSDLRQEGTRGKERKTLVAPTRKQEIKLEVAELRMLIFSLGVTRLDRIRNAYIRGTAHVGRFEQKLREVKLRWFGHGLRRDRRWGT